MSLEDDISKLLRDVTKTFGAQHPQRFGLCLFAAMVLMETVKMLDKTFPNTPWLMEASGAGSLFYFSFTLLLGFITLAIKPAEVPKDVEQKLRIIEELIAKGNYTEIEKKQVYRIIIQKYIDSVPGDHTKTDKETLKQQNIKGPQPG
jgi:hypothetical protein